MRNRDRCQIRLPPVLTDALAQEAEEIRAAIAASGIDCYPCRLEIGPHALEAPFDGDWQAFLEIAQRMRAPIIYVGSTIYEEDDAELDDDDEQPLDIAHVGMTSGVDVAFVVSGVVHSWSKVAEWTEQRFASPPSRPGLRDPSERSAGAGGT